MTTCAFEEQARLRILQNHLKNVAGMVPFSYSVAVMLKTVGG